MRLLSIITLYISICTISKAQDSTYLKLQQHKLLNDKLNNYYDAPSLKDLNSPVPYTDMNINYTQQRSEKYIWQKGSGFNNFNININSFLAKKNDINLWGGFYYNNIAAREVNYNETLDYDYLYPYIMADSVGGDLKDEHYAISGGISKLFNKTTLGLESSFIGKQSIRNRDPRTQNISSNFNIKVSANQKLNSIYNLTLAVVGERYFQKAKVEFNSELGRPNIIHETGFGNFNKLLAGSRDNAEYLGYNYGLSLHFVPSHHLGWFALAKYTGTTIDKRVQNLADIMNEAYKDNFEIQLGHKLAVNSHSKLEIGMNYKDKKLKGVEAKFHIEQSLMPILSRENLFNSTSKNWTGYISLQRNSNNYDWYATVSSSLINQHETYQIPLSEEKFEFINIEGQFGWNQRFTENLLSLKFIYNYSNPLSATREWNSFASNTNRYAMLLNNYNYKNTQTSFVDFGARLSFPVPKLQTFYIGANASHVSAYALTNFGITSGFVF